MPWTSNNVGLQSCLYALPQSNWATNQLELLSVPSDAQRTRRPLWERCIRALRYLRLAVALRKQTQWSRWRVRILQWASSYGAHLCTYIHFSHLNISTLHRSDKRSVSCFIINQSQFPCGLMLLWWEASHTTRILEVQWLLQEIIQSFNFLCWYLGHLGFNWLGRLHGLNKVISSDTY